MRRNILARARAIALAPVFVFAGFAGCGRHGGGGSSFFASSSSSTSVAAVASAHATPNPRVATPSGPVRTAPANLATGASLVLDASGQGGFFDLPFPLDARRLQNGAPDLGALPNPRNKDFIRAAAQLVATDARGFSPTGAIYFRFDGAIDTPIDDAAASTLPASAILLVDVDPSSPERLSRHPFHVAVATSADSVRPAWLLELLPVPGLGLRPKTTYAAIVLRRLGAPTSRFLGQCPALTAVLAKKQVPGALGASIAASMAPLAPALFDLKIHPDDVAAATIFTTGDPSELLTKQVAWADAQPALGASAPLAVRDLYPAFTALRARWSPPIYQAGAPPFLFGDGRQQIDAQGMPIAQRQDDAEFQLSVPKGKMPASGFPLYFYVHGTGGAASEAIDRGRYSTPTTPPPPGSGFAALLAPHGWATSCTDGWLSPGRIGLLSADGYAAYNFTNAVAMRDNFAQMILELVHFRRLVLALRIDPALCPGTDASAAIDGKVRFDPDRVVVAGQSLGSYLSGMLAATLKGFKGAVLTGAGGSWVEFPFGPKSPIDLEAWVEALTLPSGERLDRFHPFIALFDLALGPADNTHYLPHVLRAPLAGHDAPHVLVIDGHKDLQVAIGLQRALVLALGIDLGGKDVGPTPDDQIVPVLPLSGRSALPLPLRGNVATPLGPRTGVICRYLEDGIREGHYVAFQLDEPKRQIAEFCDAIAAGATPTVR